MDCVSFPGAMPLSLHLSHCGPEPSIHPWGWQQRALLTLHGWLLGQGGETPASSLEKRPSPLLAFPTELSPPKSPINREKVS